MARMRFRDRRNDVTNDNGTSFQNIRKERDIFKKYSRNVLIYRVTIVILFTLNCIQTYYLYKHF